MNRKQKQFLKEEVIGFIIIVSRLVWFIVSILFLVNEWFGTAFAWFTTPFVIALSLEIYREFKRVE